MQVHRSVQMRVRRANSQRGASRQELCLCCSSISAHRAHAAQTRERAHDARERDAARAPPYTTPTQIFIKTLTGRKQAMTFEPTDEVLQIKRQLQEKEGIQVDQIRLIYSGKQLADDKPLEFYNIQAGGTIHMVLQLRGGGGAP